MTTPPSPLAVEFWALRRTIQRLIRENADLEWLCRYLPGLANAAANIRKTEAALTSTSISIDANAIQQALAELTAEFASEEN